MPRSVSSDLYLKIRDIVNAFSIDDVSSVTAELKAALPDGEAVVISDLISDCL